MKNGSAKPVRCAVYTRVSTDHGLEQDFNSLDAQHEASQAYIRSQAHAGWTMLRSRYDDGGYSGGSTERPALQRLLEDIRARKVDIIVVYKVDRLTRSLADFAKLVELFDAHGVSFVSVTQQFNTTTSMGRLTLNVLLSFAQFEREVTPSASATRSQPPSARVSGSGAWRRSDMRPVTARSPSMSRKPRSSGRSSASYLELGSLNRLMVDLRSRDIVTKVRTLKSGKTVGGIQFTRGPLAHLLRNRFYIGEVAFKNEVLPGEQPAIIDRKLFEAVQVRLSEQLNNHTTRRTKSRSLLMGLITDDRGNRMGPTHACKGGIRYRYYVSTSLIQAQPDRAGSVTRVPAVEIEELVIKTVRESIGATAPTDDRELIAAHIKRVEIQPDRLAIELKPSKARQSRSETKQPRGPAGRGKQKDPLVIHVPWRKTPSRRKREIIVPEFCIP